MQKIIKGVKKAWKYNTVRQFKDKDYNHWYHPQRYMSFILYWLWDNGYIKTLTCVKSIEWGKHKKYRLGFTGYYFEWFKKGTYSYGTTINFLWFYFTWIKIS